MTKINLDEALPVDAAYELPSSATESMLADALASDDIDFVKSNLQHTWSHYQSLEFSLNAVADNLESIQSGIATIRARGEDIPVEAELEIAVRYFAAVALPTAYTIAHQVSVFGNDYKALTVPARLRLLYPQLNHGKAVTDTADTSSEFDADIEDFLASIFPEDEAEGGPNA